MLFLLVLKFHDCAYMHLVMEYTFFLTATSLCFLTLDMPEYILILLWLSRNTFKT